MTQLEIKELNTVDGGGVRGAGSNTLLPEDRPVHDWYRFVLSYPPHLVRKYLDAFDADQTQIVFDPFCGTGTTLVEAKKLGIPSVGAEAISLTAFAASTKTNWTVDSDSLRAAADSIAGTAAQHQGLQPNIGPNGDLCRLSAESARLLIKDSISPIPLHKCLVLRDLIDLQSGPELRAHLRLALASAAVKDASNLHFGPEVGVGKIRDDADVFGAWNRRVHSIADDLRLVASVGNAPSKVVQTDSRSLSMDEVGGQVGIVITSPPYPNEKDYTRTVRLESVLLGLFDDRTGLRNTKKQLVRSNTRGVYKDDDDDRLIDQYPEIVKIANAIEARRIELGKTSGFERLYARVTRLYFGGMKRHLESIIPMLKPGARLAYVVGDQASYLRIHIRTGQLLAKIAESIGFAIDSIDLFRTRLATATRAELREEVVVMTWPGTANAN